MNSPARIWLELEQRESEGLKLYCVASFELPSLLICNNFRATWRKAVNRPPQRALRYGPVNTGTFVNTNLKRKGIPMKQLISVLVAAMFAVASVAAVAQDKAPEKGTKTKTSQTKAKGDKPAKTPKASKKAAKKADEAKK
jgi:hypothetical protein